MSARCLIIDHDATTYCCSVVLTYVGTTARTIGISSDFAFYLVAIANASSMFGRFCAGILSDQIGPLNVMIPFTSVAGILTYAWPFTKTEATLLGVAIAYGYANIPATQLSN